MDREEAKSYVKSNLDYILRSEFGVYVRGQDKFLCLSPEHNDNNPSMNVYIAKDGYPHCKCFSCGAHYDTFDLIGIKYNLTDDKEIFNKAYEIFNLDVDKNITAREAFNGSTKPGANTPANTPSDNQQPLQAPKKVNIADFKEGLLVDFTSNIEKAHQELLNTPGALKHYTDRGLSMEIIEKYKFGCVRNHNDILEGIAPDHKASGKKVGLYNWVLPYPNNEGKYDYFITEISDRKQIDKYNGKYKKPNRKGNDGEIMAQVFNERYIQEPPTDILFICEGIYDALSVEQVGGKALALVGVGQNRLLELCKKYKPDVRFIISLDNDERGREATERIKEGLEELGIGYEVHTANNGKDFNDNLLAGADEFKSYIDGIISQAKKEKEKVENKERADYLESSVAFQLQALKDSIEKSKDAIYHPTGFKEVDTLLDGGLYSGLYIAGAISSLGKTTFCLQVADNIARSGTDVIIISLEMAKEELMAKSVSRHTLLEDVRKYRTSFHAKTTRGILTGARYKNYTGVEKQIIEDAYTEYSKYANHIYIKEGVGDIGVGEIREIVRKHIELTGNKPVLLIDYLQILAPYNEHYTDKQNTDKSVMELKRITRDYSIPIIAISSFNRNNYTEPVSMACFKESGAIEYSSDVLIGLQYEGMDFRDGEKDSDRTKRVRELMVAQQKASVQQIEVKVIKNRNGKRGSCLLEFHPMFNTFANIGGIADIEEEAWKEAFKHNWDGATIDEDEWEELLRSNNE